MAYLKTTWYGFIVLTALTLVFSYAPARGGQADVGQLRIEGQDIEQLILRDEEDQEQTFYHPGSMVTLPTGQYHVHAVRLRGGHSSEYHLIPEELSVAVGADAPATLKVGAPLRQTVRIERHGPVMALNYELIGQGGEPYAINRAQDSGKPAFAVYRGDAKVLSGEFEFG